MNTSISSCINVINNNVLRCKNHGTVFYCNWVLLIIFGACSSITIAGTHQQPTIAIVVDDMGNNYKNGAALAKLPFPLTLSFLPKRPYTKKLTKLAEEHHKEIMLHSPMENSLGIKLGSGGLRENMSRMQIQRILADSFTSIPKMVGLNNHMGSKLTENTLIMHWIMEEISQYPYFFLDSKTSASSVAAKVAEKFNIPNLTRDVFLDHKQTRKFIQKQFLKLIKIAREKGTAIAIAHPHKVTIDYLSWALPKLDEKGISIATASAIWQIQHPLDTMHTTSKPTFKTVSIKPWKNDTRKVSLFKH